MADVAPPPRIDLDEIARRAMVEHGLEPDFPPEVARELDRLTDAAQDGDPGVRDLRNLPWSSIDNEDTRDLDQLTVSQPDAADAADAVRILVAIADVDALVKRGSAIDEHARVNTTSVYTPTVVFPMLPERLSTDLTSLNERQDRLAVVVDMAVDPGGTVVATDVYRALVHNPAKLTYGAVADWLDGEGPMPAPMAAVPDLERQIRLQDDIAGRLRTRRHELGALDIQTVRTRPVVQNGSVVGLEEERPSRSRQLIEDFMIAANGATARFLREHRFPSLRRVVRAPERWDRIVKLAADTGERLPVEPDATALARFMDRRRNADPNGYPELSLAVVKLMGSGEYAVERPGESPEGHFGLSVPDYAHATAPNRRYPDLITQRLLKAALRGRTSPYSLQELEALARHCTRQEDQANKVERQVRKAASAAVLATRIGETFEATVTCASAKGTWVRTAGPPIEGKLVEGTAGVEVGERVRVRLVRLDPSRGFVDFARVT